MNFLNRYGAFDRLLHRVAFATRLPQAAIADLEDLLFRRSLESIALGPPVLITGLPRAGTTILLELLAATPTFASHTYRDMPFVLCPMAWQRFSRPFQKTVKPRTRAHDDGIEISPDSPEAFEEVAWMRFWRDHYLDSSITPWAHCERNDFADFFSRHMRKVVAVRARKKPTATRYISKNNLNIARIPAIWGILPSAIVVVPFRDPLQHAASLLRQHRRFSDWHREDEFARRYMAAIGHFDFGANLKPVNFDGWLDRAEASDPNRLQFWVDYWVAAYRHVLRHGDEKRLVLLRGEALEPSADTDRLAGVIGIDDPSVLRARRNILKPMRPHEVDLAEISEATLMAARSIHQQLCERSILG